MVKQILAGLRAKLLAGVVVIVPVIATLLALRFLLRTFDALLGPWVATLIGRDVPGLGVVATLVLLVAAGILATNFFGRRVISLVEKLFTELPFVRRIYNASKDIVESATMASRQAFRDVVMAEYPRHGVYSYGFVTSYTTRHDPDGPKRLANVFVPGPPVPTTGNLVALPVDELIFLDMSIDEALKLVLSAGMASPPDLHRRGDALPPDPAKLPPPVPT
jgi:uncharacterized membrane protein